MGKFMTKSRDKSIEFLRKELITESQATLIKLFLQIQRLTIKIITSIQKVWHLRREIYWMILEDIIISKIRNRNLSTMISIVSRVGINNIIITIKDYRVLSLARNSINNSKIRVSSVTLLSRI
jgi:hypothetical protein